MTSKPDAATDGFSLERLEADAWAPPWVRREHEERFEFCSRYVGGKRVLDCASGSGIGTGRFARAKPRAIMAIDVDYAAAAATRRQALGVLGVCGSAEALPFAAASADVFVSLETIEHLHDVTSYLREAVRVLDPGGVFLCSTPNRAVSNPNTSLRDKPFNPFHIREYDQREFEDLLARHFTSVVLYGQNPQKRPLHAAVLALASLSPRAAVLVRRALKLPGLAIDWSARHRVRELRTGTAYEYLVGVCRGPKQS